MGTRSFRRVSWLLWAVFSLLAAFLMWPLQAGAAQDVIGPGPGASALDHWQFIAGLAVPLIVATLTKQAWPDSWKVAGMLIVSGIVTAATMALQGTLLTPGDDFIAAVLRVVSQSIIFYYGVWKPLGVTGAIHQRTG